ncbi:Saposin B-type domain-containing protein [Mycena indigotica]|uniref:Saposin B-type domain-containing protein n=1 Tax=Mycena indigotica TaxID=2126181 RepID=A0A8H6VWW8_9AGAR|nr:Saposin B-type domain-containing protein [Mycena indigotica]KAF7296867.1 Saposin B-type domain-containing protein [Mycena indigotica]
MSAPPSSLHLDGSLGATLVGAVVGTFLFGIESLQVFNYYYEYTKDPKSLKTAVATVWSVGLAHSVTLWHALYSITVTFYGQPSHVLRPPHSLELTVLFSALTNITVQTFFALRIRTLSGHWPITILAFVLTTVRLSIQLVMMVFFWDSPGFRIIYEELYWEMVTVSVIGLVVDMLISGSMCWCLLVKRHETDFPQTRKMVDTLIVWCIETTSLTAAAGLLELVLFLSRPDLAWMTFFLVQPKLYSNSMLAHLNGRERLRRYGGSQLGTAQLPLTAQPDDVSFRVRARTAAGVWSEMDAKHAAPEAQVGAVGGGPTAGDLEAAEHRTSSSSVSSGCMDGQTADGARRRPRSRS